MIDEVAVPTSTVGSSRTTRRQVIDVLLNRDPVANRILRRYARWPLAVIWLVAYSYQCVRFGIPLQRESVILWIGSGLIAATLGMRPVWTVVVDWLPFAAFLIVYDYSRGIADTLGMPVHWTAQIRADEVLFAGHLPTAYLQQHLRGAQPAWWEAIISLTYLSHFVVAFTVAGLLWLRNRVRWRQFATRFVVLSFVGALGYVLVPAAPPWAAARCTHAEVRSHPADPPCMYVPAYDGAGDDALIPAFTPSDPQSQPSVERISGRGLDAAQLTSFRGVVEKGQATVNHVAAVPSLHAAFSSLFLFFFWSQARWWLRAILVGYPLLMAFTLVFTAEHYVIDVLLGWLAAGLVCWGIGILERRRSRGRLARPSGRQPGSTSDGKSVQCQPTVTTSSSA